MDTAILDATRELLARHGYAGLTMDAVAERAGIGKAAIYRRYPTKQAMVFTAALHGADLATPSDTGSLAGDLTSVVQDIVDQLAAPAAAAAVPGLLADLAGSPDLAQSFHNAFVRREQEIIATLLDRAIARGELTGPRPDVHLVHALLTGPVFTTLFVQRRSPDGLADRLARVLAGALRAGLADLPAMRD